MLQVLHDVLSEGLSHTVDTPSLTVSRKSRRHAAVRALLMMMVCLFAVTYQSTASAHP